MEPMGVELMALLSRKISVTFWNLQIDLIPAYDGVDTVRIAT
jgi:hypothetical protein